MTSSATNSIHRSVNALSSTVNESKSLHIHWFRNQDLRLNDNPALCETIKASKRSHTFKSRDSSYDGIIPIFCFDPRFIGGSTTTLFGSQKCGVRRAKFLMESVLNLRQNLEKKGSGLVVAYGKTEHVFSSILESLQQTSANKQTKSPSENIVMNVICQEEVASEELSIDKAIRKIFKGVKSASGDGNTLETVWGSTLYQISDLPFDGGVKGLPDVFTPFRNKVEKCCKIASVLPIPSKAELALVNNNEVQTVFQGMIPRCSFTYFPTLIELGYTAEEIEMASTSDPRGVMSFTGGETAALQRIQDYIWDKDLLKDYFDTRNGMLGSDYSTKISPWLAHGCISPRFIAKECKRYEEERKIVNKSTYWVVFELLWRDFFKFFAKKHGNAIFFLDGTLGKAAHGSHPNSRRWGLDRRQLEAWKCGMTGYPLVDANMRELMATGFMSNRGRQNVASFLAIDMNTDWRFGADHFEMHLLDYDVYSNWGNWCAAAGMTGGRLNRFNIVKQSKDYDAQGDYVRHWCPELSCLPTALIHEPWKMTKEQQEQYGVQLGVHYPRPIVNPTVGNPYKNDEYEVKGQFQSQRKSDEKNKNDVSKRGRNQRKDMKSLKVGQYDFD